MALHRAGQTHAECLYRELQRPAAGWIIERDAVHVAGPGSCCPPMLAGRLQRRTTTLATRMEDAFRVRLHLPPAPGSGAALCQELRASSRRSNRPTGQPKRQERTQNWIKLGGNVTGQEVSATRKLLDITYHASRAAPLRWPCRTGIVLPGDIRHEP